MTPVLEQKKAAYFVGSSDVLTFICNNSEMNWNTAHDFMYKSGICSYDQDISYWSKTEINHKKAEKNYDPDTVKWVRGWFEAHPWMENVAFVYDK